MLAIKPFNVSDEAPECDSNVRERGARTGETKGTLVLHDLICLITLRTIKASSDRISSRTAVFVDETADKGWFVLCRRIAKETSIVKTRADGLTLRSTG